MSVKLPKTVKLKTYLATVTFLIVLLIAGVSYVSSNGTVTVTVTPKSLQETASYVIFKEGSTYYAKNGTTGEIEFSGTDAATVIQSAIDAAPLETTIVAKGDMHITSTINISRRVSLIIDNLYIDSDVDGILVGTTDSSTLNLDTTLVKISGTAWFTDSYTHSIIKLQHVRSARVDVGRIFVTTGMATGDSTGIHLYADGAGTYLNSIKFQEIGGIGTGIKLECTATSGGFVHPNWFYGGWIWACDTGIKLTTENTASDKGLSTNSFYHIEIDGATKMTTGIYNEGVDEKFWDIIFVDMGTQTRLNNTAGATAKFIGGQISGGTSYVVNNGTLICESVKFFVTENSGTATITSGSTSVTVNHGLAGTPTIVTVTPSADLGDVWVDSITSTQFTIHCDSAPSSATTVYWYAEYKP